MNRYFRNLPIKHKLMVLTMGISGIALLIACTAFAVYEQAVFHRNLARDSAILAHMFGENVASGLAFNDAASIELTLQALSANERIAGACVYDQHGVITATYRRPGPAGGGDFPFPAAGPTGQLFGPGRLDTFQDITLAGEVIGRLYIGTELSELRERAWRYVVFVGLMLIFCSLVAWALAARLQGLISQPILDLARTVATVAADKNYAVRAPKVSDDELGQLIDGFNGMLAQIQERDAALQGARDQLEARVAARTSELQQENTRRKNAEASLRLLNSAVEQAKESVLITDAKLDLPGPRIVFVNPAFTVMTGYAPDEVLGLTPRILQGPRTERAVLDRLRKNLTAGEVFSGEAVNYRKNGEEFMLEWQIAPLRDAGGAITHFVAIQRDITERKKTETQLRESEERYRSLIENASDAMFTIAADGTFTSLNHAVETIAGLARADWLGHPFTAMLDPADLPVAQDMVRRILRGEVAPVHELRGNASLKRPATMEMTLVAQRDQAGKIIGVQGVGRDVTSRKQAQDELKAKTALLEAQLDSSLDGILIVDNAGKKIIQNKRLAVLWKLPGEIIRDPDDNHQLQFVLGRTKHPEQFVAKVRSLYSHPNERSQEEIEFTDGTVLDRYSGPVIGHDDKLYGRIWAFRDITERKRAEAELAKVHQELVEASRLAGMAEVATGVLHNVGNVLNSVNVSATIIADRLQRSEAGNIAKLAALFAQHQADLAAFLTADPRGRLVPGYLDTLAAALVTERASVFAELDQLRKNIDHIKEIVAVQQSYARSSGLIESVAVGEIVEDALRINAGSFLSHGIETVRDFQVLPEVSTDKHKVMEILINLVRNAKYACDDSGRPDKRITLRTRSDGHRFTIAVIDNGVGIPAENLTRIFNHGFTTRKNGHGFGLHSGALAAKELGGSLGVQSAGPGLGATFTLELPVQPDPPAHESTVPGN